MNAVTVAQAGKDFLYLCFWQQKSIQLHVQQVIFLINQLKQKRCQNINNTKHITEAGSSLKGLLTTVQTVSSSRFLTRQSCKSKFHRLYFSYMFFSLKVFTHLPHLAYTVMRSHAAQPNPSYREASESVLYEKHQTKTGLFHILAPNLNHKHQKMLNSLA